MNMSVIFLDVDGVLNSDYSTSKCRNVIGIDDDKVERLKRIVDATGAVIVLVSSWKETWSANDKDGQDEYANYLDNKLRRQKLKVLDKTFDRGVNRGHGILQWYSHKNVDRYIVIDDEVFPDYDVYGVKNHLVLTDPEVGLTDEDVDKAIEMLKGERSKCR